MLHLRRALLLLLLLVQAGCGSDSDRSERFPTDLDTSDTLDEIGNAGMSRLCSSFSDWVHDQYSGSLLIKSICTAIAVEESETAGECSESLQACLDEPPAAAEAQLERILAQAGCSAVNVEAGGCSATVGQIEDCLDALAGEIDRLELTLTCAAVGEPLDPDWWVIAVPSACESLETLCP